MRGYFGIAAYCPKRSSNVGTLWRTATTYGAAFVATVGSRYGHQASDTCKTPRHTPLHHYADLDDLFDHLPHSCPVVGVELDSRARSLGSFDHPTRALYLLGAEDNGLPDSVLSRCHYVVRIDTPGAMSLNVAVAGALVMHDRHRVEMLRGAA